jgi:hypothetical protein
MKIPTQLKPTDFEKIKLPIRWFREIPKSAPVFIKWTGKKIDDTYGNKAVLEFYGKPEFAELGILRLMQKAGWNGVWIDSYRGCKYRTQFWPRNSVEIPTNWEKLLNRIWEKAGSWAGCFDVFCWKGDEFIFIEAKRQKQDHIRETQKRWLQAAILNCRIPLKRFLIVEWTLANTA